MFEMRLALALGISRARLRAELTSSELADWLAYDHLHGLPHDRAEAQRAMVGAVCNNRKNPVPPKDLIPQMKTARADIPLAEKFAIWAAHTNGVFAARNRARGE